jgi:hypothetical protein
MNIYKKIIFFILIFLSLFQFSFSLSILDISTKTEIEYASFEMNPFIIYSNTTDLFVNFVMTNKKVSQNLTLEKCEELFCKTFDIIDFGLIENGSFKLPLKVIFSTKTENKTLNFDFIKPTISIKKILDKENKIGKIYLNYTDNIKAILKSYTILDEEENEISTSINDEKNIITFVLEKVQNLTLKIVVTDLTKSITNFEKIIEIEDIFEPRITSVFKIINKKNEKETELKIKMRDDTKLKKLIFKNNLELKTLNLEKKYKEIDLFLDKNKMEKNFSLELFDNSNNSIKENYEILNYDISTSLKNSKVSNLLLFSKYKTCVLEKIDNSTINKNLESSSIETFKVELENLILENKEYMLYFYCEELFEKKYFQTTFFWDTKLSENLNFNLNVNKIDYPIVSWDKIDDKNLPITYVLRKNGIVIYNTTDLLSKYYYFDGDASLNQNINYSLTYYDGVFNKKNVEKKIIIYKTLTKIKNLTKKIEDLKLKNLTKKNLDAIINSKFNEKTKTYQYQNQNSEKLNNLNNRENSIRNNGNTNIGNSDENNRENGMGNNIRNSNDKNNKENGIENKVGTNGKSENSTNYFLIYLLIFLGIIGSLGYIFKDKIFLEFKKIKKSLKQMTKNKHKNVDFLLNRKNKSSAKKQVLKFIELGNKKFKNK